MSHVTFIKTAILLDKSININIYYTGPNVCGKTFASLQIAHFVSGKLTSSIDHESKLNESVYKSISIHDCSNEETFKQILDSISRKNQIYSERSKQTTVVSTLIYIFKNVDILAKSFQKQFLPVMKDLIRDKYFQNFFLVTSTNLECGQGTNFSEDTAFLSFHPHDQQKLLMNEMTHRQNRRLLPESASFLGFFLRRKVIGLETSDLNR